QRNEHRDRFVIASFGRVCARRAIVNAKEVAESRLRHAIAFDRVPVVVGRYELRLRFLHLGFLSSSGGRHIRSSGYARQNACAPAHKTRRCSSRDRPKSPSNCGSGNCSIPAGTAGGGGAAARTGGGTGAKGKEYPQSPASVFATRAAT